MRTLCLSVAFLAVAVMFLGAAQGGEKKDKEVTLKGRITCAKCDLGVEEKCTTVIVVKVDKKDVTYYLDAKSGKENHKTICQAGKNGVVIGVVSTKDDKKIITATKVTFDKD